MFKLLISSAICRTSAVTLMLTLYCSFMIKKNHGPTYKVHVRPKTLDAVIFL